MQALIDRVITCEATARGTGFSTLLQQRGIHRDRLAALIERVEHGSLIARLEHANIRPGLHSVGGVNEWVRSVHALVTRGGNYIKDELVAS